MSTLVGLKPASLLQTEMLADVRFGSKAKCSAKGHVRFTPESGHVQCTSPCPLSANSGLMQRSKQHLYSITSSARASSNGGTFEEVGMSTKCQKVGDARPQTSSNCKMFKPAFESVRYMSPFLSTKQSDDWTTWGRFGRGSNIRVGLGGTK